MTILKKVWFTHLNNTIGIIVCENEMGVRKSYMGMGLGLDEDADAKAISEHGARVPKGILEELLKDTTE